MSGSVRGDGRRREAGPERGYDPAEGDRHDHRWGYKDTRFEFCGSRTVRVTGGRYPLCGRPLPHFVPFVEEALGVSLDPEHRRPAAPPPDVPPPVRNLDFLEELERRLPAGRVTEGDRERLVHSHGQLSVDEVHRVLRGHAPPRLVDLVVAPREESEVVVLVETADRHGVVLIPYGGGTNVTGALLPPVEESRMVVSVDMRRMNRILELDRENSLAVVEAGITGKELERRLAAEGLTCGHEPDSIEFSTLGGWISTNASGMKKNRYGNIEEVVLEASLVTPTGKLETRPATPRNSTGVQPRGFLFGSEGGLGIVTRAAIQVHPLPETRKYGSFVFPSFRHGTGFLKALQDAGVRPASVRLANNTEFRLGRALEPERGPWASTVSRLKKAYLLRVKGFEPTRMVACTVVMEGTREEVRRQERALGELADRFGGLAGGARGGRRGYEVTFAIAYIRDFLTDFDILGETFETSAPWDRIEPICVAVQEELVRQCDARGVLGRPYLSYRLSQSYRTGVCIYFTMGFCGRGLDRPDETFQAVERRLREVILERGGSLSHHHGVGKIRRHFLPRVHSAGALRALTAVKRAVDPNDVFAARNGAFGLDEIADTPGAEPTAATEAAVPSEVANLSRAGPSSDEAG